MVLSAIFWSWSWSPIQSSVSVWIVSMLLVFSGEPVKRCAAISRSSGNPVVPRSFSVTEMARAICNCSGSVLKKSVGFICPLIIDRLIMLIHTLLMTIINWIDQASCSSPSGRANWFAEEGTIELLAALHICRTKCPVKDECLQHAVESGENHGTWGGATPRQRLFLTRKRGQHSDSVLTPRRY